MHSTRDNQIVTLPTQVRITSIIVVENESRGEVSMAHQTGIEREFRHGSVITTVIYTNTKLYLCVHVRF